MHPSLVPRGQRAVRHQLTKEEKKKVDAAGGSLGKFLEDAIALEEEGILKFNLFNSFQENSNSFPFFSPQI
jgi:hypothetical protein